MIKGNKNQNNRKIRVPAPSVAKQMFSFSEQSVSGFWSVFVFVCVPQLLGCRSRPRILRTRAWMKV